METISLKKHFFQNCSSSSIVVMNVAFLRIDGDNIGFRSRLKLYLRNEMYHVVTFNDVKELYQYANEERWRKTLRKVISVAIIGDFSRNNGFEALKIFQFLKECKNIETFCFASTHECEIEPEIEEFLDTIKKTLRNVAVTCSPNCFVISNILAAATNLETLVIQPFLLCMWDTPYSRKSLTICDRDNDKGNFEDQLQILSAYKQHSEKTSFSKVDTKYHSTKYIYKSFSDDYNDDGNICNGSSTFLDDVIHETHIRKRRLHNPNYSSSLETNIYYCWTTTYERRNPSINVKCVYLGHPLQKSTMQFLSRNITTLLKISICVTSEDQLQKIWQLFQLNLQALQFLSITAYTEDTLCFTAAICNVIGNQLKLLKLNQWSKNKKGRYLAEILQYCPLLTKLTITCAEIDQNQNNNTISIICYYCVQLEILELNGVTFNTELPYLFCKIYFDKLLQLQKLRELHLSISNKWKIKEIDTSLARTIIRHSSLIYLKYSSNYFFSKILERAISRRQRIDGFVGELYLNTIEEERHMFYIPGDLQETNPPLNMLFRQIDIIRGSNEAKIDFRKNIDAIEKRNNLILQVIQKRNVDNYFQPFGLLPLIKFLRKHRSMHNE